MPGSFVHGILQARILGFMEFSRPECWSGKPFPSPGDLPNPQFHALLPDHYRGVLTWFHRGPGRQVKGCPTLELAMVSAVFLPPMGSILVELLCLLSGSEENLIAAGGMG